MPSDRASRPSARCIDPRAGARAVDAQPVGANGIVERLAPLSALLYGLSAWVALLIVAPVDPVWPSSLEPVALLVLAVAAMGLGCVLPATFYPVARTAFLVAPARFRKALTLCLVLGLAGAVLKLMDLLVLRGIAIGDPIDVARSQAERGGSSIVSILAAALGPFGLASLALAAAGKSAALRARIGLAPLLLAAAIPAMGLLLGSRSTLMMACLYGIVIAALLAVRITARQAALTFTATLAMLLGFNLLFLLRLQQYGIDARFAARYSAYTELVPTTRAYLDLVDNGGMFGGLLAGLASLFQYALSGIFEFFSLVDSKREDFGFGAYQFSFIDKFIAFVTGGSAQASDIRLDLLNPRTGVFQSFFGPAYIDFGYFVVVFSLAFGAAAGFARRAVLAGNLFALPLYVLFIVQILLVPMIDGLTASAGALANIGYWLLALCGGYYARLPPSPN